jgi:hypothetical protein
MSTRNRTRLLAASTIAIAGLAPLPACTNTEKNPAFEPSVPVAEGRRPVGLYGERAHEPPLAQPEPAHQNR